MVDSLICNLYDQHINLSVRRFKKKKKKKEQIKQIKC